MAGLAAVRSAALAGLIRPASELGTTVAGTGAGTATGGGTHRMLPVLSELRPLLPGRGLRRGATVAVTPGSGAPARVGDDPTTADGPAASPPRRRPRPAGPLPEAPGGASSLLLALLAEASRAGSWCAVVGVPTFGAVAAAEIGIALERLALIPNPGPEWATVVAALIDGLDVVVVAVPDTVAASVANRLAARARQRGSVLVPYGRWAGADVTLQVVRGVWEGLGQGRGRLRRREVTICARGRGAAARPKQIQLWLPRAAHGFTAPAAAPPAESRPAALTLMTAAAPAELPARLSGQLAPEPAEPAATNAPGRVAVEGPDRVVAEIAVRVAVEGPDRVVAETPRGVVAEAPGRVAR